MRRAGPVAARVRQAVLRGEGRPFGTGLRMFLVLIVALLPLGVVAVLGTIQTIRNAEMERAAVVRLSAAQGASRLLAALNSDRAALRLVANSLADDSSRTGICQRASRQLQTRAGDVEFGVYDRAGRLLCGSPGPPPAREVARAFGEQFAWLLSEQGQLGLKVESVQGRIAVVARYTAAQLVAMAEISAPTTGFMEAALTQRGARLWLVRQGVHPDPRRTDHASAPLNLSDIELALVTEQPPVRLMRIAATMLPLFLWIAAAGIGWWVVNRFLIRPLIDLNRQVATYQPGTMLNPTPVGPTLVREITNLAGTFREMAQDVVEHEAQLADALVHQRALTREVHHRVKNNLQIISSLINLHSRAAHGDEAAMAYASIQRRVDALSVVHRNHYAAAEFNRGIDARALISELGSALRASGPGADRGGFTIRVDSDHLYLSQDIAVPIAFLITELVELVILSGRPGPVSITLHRQEDMDGMAELSVTADALRPSAEVDLLIAERFGRVLTGLSRQLRATLTHQPGEGRYAILLPARS